jgi:hypothetical protein
MAKRPLTTVNSILNRVVGDLGLEQRLREHTFMSLWPTFISSALAQRSRPLFIDAQRNLVISAADAATGQELSMLKGKVAPQVQKAAHSLGIQINGLRLDLKHYHQQSMMLPQEEPPALPKPSDADLAAESMNEGELLQLQELSTSLQNDASVTSECREKILTLFEKQLRLRRFRLKNGYPQCPRCCQPAERLHRANPRPGEQSRSQPLCLTCLYSS